MSIGHLDILRTIHEFKCIAAINIFEICRLLNFRAELILKNIILFYNFLNLSLYIKN